MTPAIGAHVQPRLSNQQQSQSQGQQQESGPRAQVRGKPKAVPIGSVRRGNTIFARYRMESMVEVPVGTVDSRGRVIPMKTGRISFPVPSFDQVQGQQQPQQRRPSYSYPPTVRSLQDQVLEPPPVTEPPVRSGPTPQTAADGSQYYVIQNPDGTQNLVIKIPGQPVMMTPLPKPPAGSAPQKYIIRQGPVPEGAAAAVVQAQNQAQAQSQSQSQSQGQSQKSGQASRSPASSKSGESTSLQDKYSEKAPDVLINYGTDDLQAGELGKTLDNGRVRVPKVDPKEREELLKERKETQERMRNEWEHRLAGDDHMDSED